MRILLSSIIRAVIAAAVGYLLVIYRTDMVRWLTIAIGTLFLVSGIISVIIYFSEKRKARNAAERLSAMAEMREGIEAPATADDIMRAMTPSFPIVGIGSILLGIILALMPAEFVKGAMYCLAAILILGAIAQIFALVSVRKLSHIPIFFWLPPVAVLAVGIIVVVRPMDMSALPFRILGWGLMLYAIVEVINAVHIYSMRRSFEQAQPYDEAQTVPADGSTAPTTGETAAAPQGEEPIEEAEIVEMS